MRKKKDRKIVSTEEHNKLIRLLAEYTPKDRQNLLREIDGILCHFLNLDEKDLPWLNPQKHSQLWEELMTRLRLVVGKIEYESKQKIERTIH